jgi:type VI secretion system protein ImpL
MFLKADPVLWSLGALIALVMLVLGFILWVASRPEKEPRSQQRRLTKMRNDSLRSSFRQAIELIEANIATRAQRLSVPWVLVLNEGSDTAPLPLDQSGLTRALSTDAAATAVAQGISWNFFDKGIVINMLGAYLGSPDNDDDTERPWDEFLSLCRDYRPERPFDSLVITVPVDLLLSSDPNARLELSQLAKLSNRRLWKAQNRFAMRFSMYVVVSGCERLPGFAPFARAVPEAMRKSILGWSSPFEITASYEKSWVNQAIDHTIQTLSDTSAELYVLNLQGNSSPYFLLPGQLDSLRSQLQLYVDELMRPSTYHEPFLMRGIYFTGNAGEAAALEQRPAAANESLPALLIDSSIPSTPSDDKKSAGAGGEDAAAGLSKDILTMVQKGAESRSAIDIGDYSVDSSPVFLRDLFEQKIFAEYGLARPSGSQLTSRPMLGRGARWAAWVLIGGWSLGLVIGSVIVHKQSDALYRVLVKFKQDNERQALSQRNGETISADFQNSRALAVLGVMEQMDRTHLWSIFMPGSWPVIDQMPTQIRDYLEEAFSENAAATLQRALQFQVSQLTGVPQDESTGELIQEPTCAPPDNTLNANANGNTLGFEDLPEFASLLVYISAVEQTEKAYGAMQRLQTPNLPPDPRDLQLLVKLVTGQDLISVSQHSSELFRSKTASAYRVRPEPAQNALRCGLRKLTLRLQEKAFDNNVLLNSHRDLTASINSFTEAVESIDDGQTQLETLALLLDEIKAHDTLLASGADGAAWMSRPLFQPGATWNSLMARITASPMLGMSIAERTQRTFEHAYRGFGIELNEELTDNPISEVFWDAKLSRFTFGADLSSLRGGLKALLAEPYMTTANNLPAPELGSSLDASQALHWDLMRLNEALAAQEQRKKFKSDLLPQFPLNSLQMIDQIVKARLTNQVMLHVNAALVTNTKPPGLGTDLRSMEAEQSRLMQVQQLLAELGAQREGDALRTLITRDALRRLQVLDDTLTRSDLYTPKGRSFSLWQGEKGPVLGAFGLPDASALQPYLAQQAARAEQLSKEAEAVISLLNPSAANSIQVQRWRGISSDLERFKLKNPNSSLLALENFLIAMAGDVDAQNCSDRLLGKVPSGRPTDFFAERHAQLGISLSLRCEDLRLKEQRGLWSSFAQDFNRTLAGRPPFASPGWSADAPALDASEVAQLLRDYDKAKPALQALIQNQKGTAVSTTLQRFSDQFDRSRSFLAPLAPVEENAPIGYDISVEFRANQGAEIQGNKVIDWTLDIGQQRLSLRDTPKPLRWEPGQPIALTLRLAKDSQVSPLADPRQPALSADGKTVTLRFTDAWSLFNLIARQREAEARSDGRGQLLRLEFPLQADNLPAPSAASSSRIAALPQATSTDAGESRARVFLRLTLSPPGKKTPLLWPGLLPTQAPELNKPQ